MGVSAGVGYWMCKFMCDLIDNDTLIIIVLFALAAKWHNADIATVVVSGLLGYMKGAKK